jgi:hypothetical protein
VRKMTLIVTEVSEAFGCVVVGDSAVTNGTTVSYGAEKVHYSSSANIGFALWGNACLSGRRLDVLLSAFVAGLGASETPRSAGTALAALLVEEVRDDGRDWLAARGGVHICGYEDSVPVLFHVHTGAEPPAPQEPFRLHEDYPDASSGYHLRNGYYKTLAGLFDGMQHYVEHLAQLGYEWPHKFVEDRVSYYSILVETIAQTLKASRRIPSIGGLVSAVAFNRDGIQVDKRVVRGTQNFCVSGTSLSASFAEPPSNPYMHRTRFGEPVM